MQEYISKTFYTAISELNFSSFIIFFFTFHMISLGIFLT